MYFEIYDNSNNEPLKCFVRFNIEDCLVDDDVMIRPHYFENNDMLLNKMKVLLRLNSLIIKEVRFFILVRNVFFIFILIKK
ncbi:hypothetical protein B4907_20605 [Yersinia kristensenii]|nr:hypothetical protein B4907_20605 [Yersinia kristensenii]